MRVVSRGMHPLIDYPGNSVDPKVIPEEHHKPTPPSRWPAAFAPGVVGGAASQPNWKPVCEAGASKPYIGYTDCPTTCRLATRRCRWSSAFRVRGIQGTASGCGAPSALPYFLSNPRRGRSVNSHSSTLVPWTRVRERLDKPTKLRRTPFLSTFPDPLLLTYVGRAGLEEPKGGWWSRRMDALGPRRPLLLGGASDGLAGETSGSWSWQGEQRR